MVLDGFCSALLQPAYPWGRCLPLFNILHDRAPSIATVSRLRTLSTITDRIALFQNEGSLKKKKKAFSYTLLRFSSTAHICLGAQSITFYQLALNPISCTTLIRITSHYFSAWSETCLLLLALSMKYLQDHYNVGIRLGPLQTILQLPTPSSESNAHDAQFTIYDQLLPTDQAYQQPFILFTWPQALFSSLYPIEPLENNENLYLNIMFNIERMVR